LTRSNFQLTPKVERGNKRTELLEQLLLLFAETGPKRDLGLLLSQDALFCIDA
jgi:hypothetical protein